MAIDCFDCIDVKCPTLGLCIPIDVPSILPPLISAVVTVPKFVIVEPWKLYSLPAVNVPSDILFQFWS